MVEHANFSLGSVTILSQIYHICYFAPRGEELTYANRVLISFVV